MNYNNFINDVKEYIVFLYDLFPPQTDEEGS